MEGSDLSFIIFFLLYLFLFVTYKWGATVVLKFFQFGRWFYVKAAKRDDWFLRFMGLEQFDRDAMFNPARKEAERLLFWGGLVGAIGVAFAITWLVLTGFVAIGFATM